MDEAIIVEAINKEGQLPEVAIVILNWNGINYLQKFLPFVLAGTYANKRVIVADNASTDDSLVFVREHFPSVEIIVNESNEGFAKGYNTALKKVASDYYILLNSDVEVTNNWIEPVIKLMENDPLIGVCQPKILSYTDRSKFEYAGAGGGWMDNFGYPFARGRIFEHCENDNGQYDDAAQCFWASGAALFVRAKFYHELGGLDEYFFAHQEEIDFCWRMQLSGYKVYVQPASVVFHVGGGTLPKGNSRKTYLNFRNNLIMLFKNLPWHHAIWKIPFRMCLDALAAWKSLFDKQPSSFSAIATAHVSFIRWLFSSKRHRGGIKKKNENISGWYNGSVVWDYFIRRKKTFLEIVEYK